MIIEKCTTCSVIPEVSVNDQNLKKIWCTTCHKNENAVPVKAAKEAAKKWNDVNN